MKYSKVAYLGKLNQYSKDELIHQLEGFRYYEIRKNEFSELVGFEGEGIIIELRFDLQGKFMEIVHESWLEPRMVYNKFK